MIESVAGLKACIRWAKKLGLTCPTGSTVCIIVDGCEVSRGRCVNDDPMHYQWSITFSRGDPRKYYDRSDPSTPYLIAPFEVAPWVITEILDEQLRQVEEVSTNVP